MSLRVKRQKKIQKIIRYYNIGFNIKDPYKLLCEPSFIYQSLEKKLHIKEQLPKLLGGRVTPMVTSCGMEELRRLKREIGDQFIGSIVIAKGFYRIKCGHDENPLGAAECCAELLKNRENKWIMASQDENLRSQIREIPGVPLLYLAGQVPTLEQPSQKSTTVHEENEQQKLEIHNWEYSKLPEKERLKTLEELRQEQLQAKKKKRKKEHFPHPLSNLKKKKDRKNKNKKKEGEKEKAIDESTKEQIRNDTSPIIQKNKNQEEKDGTVIKKKRESKEPKRKRIRLEENNQVLDVEESPIPVEENIIELTKRKRTRNRKRKNRDENQKDTTSNQITEEDIVDNNGGKKSKNE